MLGFRHDEQLTSDLMQTLSVLLVRTEFCKKVVDGGGLDLVKEAVATFPSSQVNFLSRYFSWELTLNFRIYRKSSGSVLNY